MTWGFLFRSPAGIPLLSPDSVACAKGDQGLQPYFDSINIGGNHAPANTTDRPSSSVLFQAGDERSVHEEQIKREILLEKWKGTMQLIAGGTSNENTRRRAIIGEAISGTRSQTDFERKPLEEIQRCVNFVVGLEKRLAIDRPGSDQDLRVCCAMAAEDVDHPGKNATFAEALTAGKANGADDSESLPF